MAKKQAKAKAPKEKAAKRPAKARPTRPKDRDLPGMEARAIKPLEDVAEAYADIRDQRMALNREEHILKQNALKLMKRFEKVIYKRNGITIQVIEGEQEIKVRVKKPKDGDDASDDDTTNSVETGLGETAPAGTMTLADDEPATDDTPF